jgi:hypothetical protein
MFFFSKTDSKATLVLALAHKLKKLLELSIKFMPLFKLSIVSNCNTVFDHNQLKCVQPFPLVVLGKHMVPHSQSTLTFMT